MAYEKQGFVDGMILKAENLVKIEEGIIEAEESVEASVQDALEEAKESGEFDGKSAYQYAQEGGFTGTEATFAERLARGNIHIGTDAPADGSEVWIDTDEEPTSEEPTSGGSIDVTAEVGQTIIVKEVDENGKPTKWESADYQPRTHWSEEGKVQVLSCETHMSELDETYGIYAFGLGFNAHLDSLPLTSIYSVEYDGVEYTNLATVELQGIIFFGNLYFLNDLFGTSFGYTGEPFILGGDSSGMMMLTLDSQETTHAVKIYTNGTYHHPLDMCYFPKIPTIDLTRYYSTIENNSTIDISGDNLFEELYEVMRKNEIVRIVHRDTDGHICTGIGFVTRMAGYMDLFVSIPSVHNKTLNIQAHGETARLYYS